MEAETFNDQKPKTYTTKSGSVCKETKTYFVGGGGFVRTRQYFKPNGTKPFRTVMTHY